jgi:predicted anti-sigma-YlaC factor YlaD
MSGSLGVLTRFAAVATGFAAVMQGVHDTQLGAGAAGFLTDGG